MFPLGKTGGLIEAAGPLRQRLSADCFRWVKPAASLKQIVDRPLIVHVRGVSAG